MKRDTQGFPSVCRYCEFFHPEDGDGFNDVGDGAGRCRKNSPRLIKKKDFEGDSIEDGVWPYVANDDWCGKFQFDKSWLEEVEIAFDILFGSKEQLIGLDFLSVGDLVRVIRRDLKLKNTWDVLYIALSKLFDGKRIEAKDGRVIKGENFNLDKCIGF